MFKISIFRTDVRDYSDIYGTVIYYYSDIFKGANTVQRNASAQGYNIQLLLKNFWITLNLNNTSIKNGEDLDVIMTMYNL